MIDRMIELVACSGPGAPTAISNNIHYGWVHAAIFGGLAAGSVVAWFFGRRWFLIPLFLLCMLAMHPAWMVSAIRGDCGSWKRTLSDRFTWTAIVLLVVQIAASWWLGSTIHAQRRRRGECPACGYDLRGSAGRGECPECGAATTEAAQ